MRTTICLEIEVTDEKILNKTSGKSFHVISWPEDRQVIINPGGLIAFTCQRLLQRMTLENKAHL